MSRNKDLIAKWALDYTEPMYSWTVNRVSDSNVAEDLVQDTFLSALKSIDSFQGKSNPKTWLFSILKNKIADFYRKQFKLQTISESKLNVDSDDGFFGRFFDKHGEWKKEYNIGGWEEDQVELLDDYDFKELLQACLKALSEKGFLAIQYKYLEEKDGKIICQELGITPSNFWQLLHRAKIQLRECLDDNWFKREERGS